MGKSPGKWIKSVLFGKKSSKSSVLKKAGTEKEIFIVANATSSDLAVNPPLVSNPEPFIEKNEHNIEAEQGQSTFPQVVTAYFPDSQDVNTKGTRKLDGAEILEKELAAAKVQAAFRGYLARRAFWALKGIIRLQALIRGHLVRRQALATLHCVHGIVKLQTLVRSQRVRSPGATLDVENIRILRKTLGTNLKSLIGVTKSTQLEKLPDHAFIRKLLASSPTAAAPLSLQYDLTELNSAWNWCERWSLSRFWESLLQSSKVEDFRKNPTDILPVDSEISNLTQNGKPRNSPKKTFVHQPESLEGSPQNEIERVKRSLRKITAPTTKANESKMVFLQKNPKAIELPAPDVSEKLLEYSKVDVSETRAQADIVTLDEDQADFDPRSLAKGAINQNISLANEENENTKENHSTRRRKSLSSKQEYLENNQEKNSPALPSYMAATQSAKAKLRAAENGHVRRHSLSHFTSGKSNSQSPKLKKVSRASFQGGAKVDRSLLSSRDNNENVIHAEWKR